MIVPELRSKGMARSGTIAKYSQLAKKLLGRRVPLVLLTGGDRNILKKSYFFDIVDSSLTLKGIAAVYAEKEVGREKERSRSTRLC